MKKELEDRLRIVYATGRLRRHMTDRLYDFAYREKIHNALCTNIMKIGANVFKQPVWEGRVVFEWVISLTNNPGFTDWTSLSYENQTKWFIANKRNYPVLWLQCSRVWTAYYWYYNIWSKPSKDNKKMIECIYKPYANEWISIHKEIDNIMKSMKIDYLSNDKMHEVVPFVLNEMWLDKDNGSSCADIDEDDESLPYLDETAVGTCQRL